MRPVSRSPRLTMSRGPPNTNLIRPYKDNALPPNKTGRPFKAMTISVHPARKLSEEVPPGTWEGTKQDAVLATAQLFEVLSRKKSGEKLQFGYSEYDAQMANAQLRAFKLTKVIMRKAKRSSLSDSPVKIEDMGFQVDGTPDDESEQTNAETQDIPKSSTPPPNAPLPSTPKQLPIKVTPRSNSSSPSGRKVKPNTPSSPVPATKFPPPIPPRKSSYRHGQLPPVAVSSRRFSDEVSPKTVPEFPVRATRTAYPTPINISPLQITLETPDKETLPVLPFRRVKFENQESSIVERCDTPTPELKPTFPPRSPLRKYSIERPEIDITAPLMPKRGSIRRSVSFRFGEGLQNSTFSRTSSLICHELSDALKDLQRTIGAATLEVH